MVDTLEDRDLVHDWAAPGRGRVVATPAVMLNDETLRDGLQSASVTDPPVEAKVAILHQMERLGIETACVGLPGAGPRQREAAKRLCREIADKRLRIGANCAGRTLAADIRPMLEISQETGIPVEVCVFIASSPIRQYTQDWDMDRMLRLTREAVALGVGEGMDVMYVTEDTTRSSPEHLKVLLTAAVEAGAKRVCLCDTVGAAVPEGAANLVAWAKALLEDLGADVGIDWHGHRDRGLGLANTLAAIDAGATRVHGTALGVGERAGNTAMEQILVNLRLLGRRHGELDALQDYVETASAALGVPIPTTSPIVGRDAFRTATGVHAAAVIKAKDKGDDWLADRVYSSVPAGWVGRQQEIEVGHMSGASNVTHYLRTRGLPHGPTVVAAVLAVAKRSERLLTPEEVQAIVGRTEEPAGSSVPSDD